MYGDEINFAAPGVNIWTSCVYNENWEETNDAYICVSGTSMATPHVSAACALLKMEDPNRTRDEILRILEDQACDDFGDKGWDKYYGSGIINLGKIVKKQVNEKAINWATKTFKWKAQDGTETPLLTGDGTGYNLDGIVNRMQALTFIWRLNGARYVDDATLQKYGNTFKDVEFNKNNWFSSAIAWAVEGGITNGTSATTFSPNNNCTRGQFITFLYRSPNAGDGAHPGASIDEAVKWAYNKGVIDQEIYNNNTKEITRGEAVEIMYAASK